MTQPTKQHDQGTLTRRTLVCAALALGAAAVAGTGTGSVPGGGVAAPNSPAHLSPRVVRAPVYWQCLFHRPAEV
jgi:hypothetical protein